MGWCAPVQRGIRGILSLSVWPGGRDREELSGDILSVIIHIMKILFKILIQIIIKLSIMSQKQEQSAFNYVGHQL